MFTTTAGSLVLGVNVKGFYLRLYSSAHRTLLLSTHVVCCCCWHLEDKKFEDQRSLQGSKRTGREGGEKNVPG